LDHRAGGFGLLRSAAVVNGDVGAFLSESNGNGLADAGGRARDQYVSALKSFHDRLIAV
jgi:hypothetical protein